MPLTKIRYQDWEASFAYAPPLVTAVINTDEIESAVACDSRGEGPFMRIRLRSGTTLIAQGRPEDLLS